MLRLLYEQWNRLSVAKNEPKNTSSECESSDEALAKCENQEDNAQRGHAVFRETIGVGTAAIDHKFLYAARRAVESS